MEYILNLPRLVRILFVGFVALCTVLAIFPLVDRIYLAYFYHPSTIGIAAYLSVFMGAMMYVFGWLQLVGSAGRRQEPSRFVVPYLVLSFLIIVLDVLLIIQGLSMTDAFAIS